MLSDKIIRRRKRIQLVCTNCKRRKKKCDRKQPCTQCTKSGILDSCYYFFQDDDEADTMNEDGAAVGASRNQRQDIPMTHEPQALTAQDEITFLKQKILGLEENLLKEAGTNGLGKTTNDQSRSWNKPSDFDAGKVEGTMPLEFNNHISEISETHPNGHMVLNGNDIALLGSAYVNPYGHNYEEISFYDNPKSTQTAEPIGKFNMWPLAWPMIMQKDPLAIILRQRFNRKHVSSFLRELQQKDLRIDLLNVDKASVINREKVGLGSVTNKSFDKVLPTDIFSSREKIKLDVLLLEDLCLRTLLPKKKAIWLLLNHFFSSLYPFLPLVDEEDFRSEITKIIGPCTFEEEDVDEISVSAFSDLSYLGILVVVLRITYLSLLLDDGPDNRMKSGTDMQSAEEKTFRYLSMNPVSHNVISIAEFCFTRVKSFDRISMPFLQLLLFMKLYHLFAPEMGLFCDASDSALNALIVHVAYALGFNRDPPKIDKFGCPRRCLLIRKIWKQILLIDVKDAVTFGSPLTTHEDYFDTADPQFEGNDANVHEKKCEEVACDAYNFCAIYLEALMKIIRPILSVRKKMKVAELCEMLTELELKTADHYSGLDECLRSMKYGGDINVVTKSFKVAMFLMIKEFLLTIFYRLCLYFYTKREISYFYLRKMLILVCVEVMPYYFDVLENKDGSFSSFFVNPVMVMFAYKSDTFLMRMLLKLNFIIYRLMQMDPSERSTEDLIYLRKLSEVSSAVALCVQISITALSKISNWYYYAWRIARNDEYVLKTLLTEDFYKEYYDNFCKLPHQSLQYSELDDLLLITQSLLTKFRKSSVRGESFYEDFIGRAFSFQKSSTGSVSSGISQGNKSHIFDTEDVHIFSPLYRPESNSLLCSTVESTLPDEVAASLFKPTDDTANEEIDKRWFELFNSKRFTSLDSLNFDKVRLDGPDIQGWDEPTFDPYMNDEFLDLFQISQKDTSLPMEQYAEGVDVQMLSENAPFY